MAKPREARRLRVVGWIHGSVGGDPSPDALAEAAAIRRFPWHRVWRAMTV